MINRSTRRPAFSVVELLVCIGIISLLIGLMMPAIQRVRSTAERIHCQSNLRQMGIALHQFHNEYGHFPDLKHKDYSEPRKSISLQITWLGRLLPYIEQNALWGQTIQAVETGIMAYENPPHLGYASVIPLFACPADERLKYPMRDAMGNMAALTSYVGNAGAIWGDGVLTLYEIVSVKNITNGVSSTIMVGERPPPNQGTVGRWYTMNWDPSKVANTWIGPQICLSCSPVDFSPNRDDPCLWGFDVSCLSPGRVENPCDRYHYWSLHPGGAHFLMVDGSSHFFKYCVPNALLRALCTRAGGEPVELPDD